MKKAPVIRFQPESKTFRLDSRDSTLLLAVNPLGGLGHLYWGSSLAEGEERKLLEEWRDLTRDTGPNANLDLMRREFADFGHNDLRCPAFILEQPDGSRITEFKYISHEITHGKPSFPGLPSTACEAVDKAETLKVTLRDKPTALELDLFYTLYPQANVLVRRTRLRNQGAQSVQLLKFASLGLDLPAIASATGGKPAAEYHLVSFGGAWARERMFQERPLLQGTVRLESRRGISSHDMNPFVMVRKGAVDEERGEVYGLALSYSGNWLLEAEVNHLGWLRLNMGLNDFGFNWRLEPGGDFTAPECVTAYSPKGYGELSLTFHRFIRDRVLRGPWDKKERPILINNWEATYFNFTHEDIVRIGRSAAEAGIEMLVLDDGWFGHRDKDDSSLGDWTADPRKLPQGIGGLAREIHGLGLKFGLWIEPEMVSPKSQLYEKHPDWCLHAGNRERKTSRWQLVLDMTRNEVRDYLFETIGQALEEGQVDYVKWDMNRSLAEAESPSLSPHRQGEAAHRYCLGVYELMERFTRRFPETLFEGCAGGGGRFDLGILSYQPQIWSSDNMDGLDRLLIQYGTSFCYPAITQGSHIGASPNQITKRESPLKWRALLAMSANLGVEADISKWSVEERGELAAYVALYKEIRPLVQFGDFHRLEAPYDSPRAAWMFTRRDQKKALLFVFQISPPAGSEVKPIRLRGLAVDFKYEIKGEDATLTGGQLMSEGWLPRGFHNGSISNPFHCSLYRLIAKG
jgi:alpha-galactosidase